jgi:hypothetical protein
MWSQVCLIFQITFCIQLSDRFFNIMIYNIILYIISSVHQVVDLVLKSVMSHVLMRTMFCMRTNVISNLNQTVKKNVKSYAMIYCQMNCINGELGFGVNALLFVMKECRGGSFYAIIITDTLWKKVNAIRINDRMIPKLVICINAKEIGKQVTGRRYSFVRSLRLHSRLPLKMKNDLYLQQLEERCLNYFSTF